jgi:hypothetical protein
MESDADPKPTTDSVVAIQRHAGWLVQLGLLTQGGASEVQRALEHALAESKQDRVAVAAVVDALMHALDQRLLDPDLFVVDPSRGAGGVATFHIAPVLAVLAATRLLTATTRDRLKRLLPLAEHWFPESGLRGFQQRYTFASRDRRRGLELDLALGRAFLKRCEAVPSR